ncbi:hypothetical protein MITS9508_01894 [Synechococcus sp. MIT S9508]|nr:hypothetical protein MITS9508_01894 [Synechococcus sp. MIT S9508]
MEECSESLCGGQLMKRLLLALPLLLTASCAGAADITTEEPFQITCTWTKDGESGDDTFFIDPKLDIATMEYVDSEDGKTYEFEYIVTKVTPTKIVISTEWNSPDEHTENHWRDENVIDRSSGELTPFSYELGRELLSQGWEGKSVDLDYEYDCQKPTRD